ncbi:MAG TPA: glycosyltransferase family 4 protein, partial [Chthonomonadales bacterium]|nr:glycosyltransferase family 4 protein [Chthonomonadales bacterium]
LRQEHRRSPFHLAHGLFAGKSGLIAALFGRLMGSPSVVSALGGEFAAIPEIGFGSQLSVRGRLETRMAVKLATAVTNETRFSLRLLHKLRPDTITIPLGAESDRFVPPPAPVACPPWRLLHVASLNRVKDQPTLLRAFARIHRAEPAAELDIVGEDNLHGTIQALAGELGLDIAFHGFQPSSVVAAMMRRSHLLLHSSMFEAGQIVLLEAACCGVPTVGTAVGFVDDLSRTAAVAAPVGDDRTIAQAALALLHDDAQRTALAEAARKFALAHDANWTAAQFMALYNALTRRAFSPVVLKDLLCS